MLIKRHWNGE